MDRILEPACIAQASGGIFPSIRPDLRRDVGVIDLSTQASSFIAVCEYIHGG